MAEKAKMKCPECGSLRTWRVGMVPTRSGPKQRYKCYACAASFYAPADRPKPKRVRKSRAKSVKKAE